MTWDIVCICLIFPEFLRNIQVRLFPHVCSVLDYDAHWKYGTYLVKYPSSRLKIRPQYHRESYVLKNTCFIHFCESGSLMFSKTLGLCSFEKLKNWSIFTAFENNVHRGHCIQWEHISNNIYKIVRMKSLFEVENERDPLLMCTEYLQWRYKFDKL